ncbi:oxidoreductase [Paractinoplanes rishiriensis]|uniref:Oxidoreductase n=1 Tax=Paractinoplanes rishiriensis TaxID=1050105 RepID=A0A919K243_9ACTN|nr:oxidoreductase [Actinoplanes rishiriensis]
MLQRKLGDVGVGAIGLGALPMSVEGRPDRAQSVATIHAALDCGVTLIDTADCYGIGPGEVGHNERLIGEVLAARGAEASGVVVATKGGQYRTPDGGYHANGRPEHLRLACEASLRATGRDHIDLYQLHAVDPAVPFLDAVGALAGLQREGKVRMVGLSNVTVPQIIEAGTVVAVVSVQNRLSPGSLAGLAELRHCAAAGIAFLPWAPLGGLRVRGTEPAGTSVFAAIGAERGWSAQRVCLAWHLALAPVTIPIPGASRPGSIIDSASAAASTLSGAELARIDEALGIGAEDRPA